MLPLEFIERLFFLDLQWFVELAMDNIFWVFFFGMAAFIYHDMKWSWKIYFVTIFWFWICVPFIGDYLGLVYLVGGFLFLNYMSRLLVTTFTETIPSLKGRLALVMLLQFFAVLIIYNLFLV
jgi:hypothetical protein